MYNFSERFMIFFGEDPIRCTVGDDLIRCTVSSGYSFRKYSHEDLVSCTISNGYSSFFAAEKDGLDEETKKIMTEFIGEEQLFERGLNPPSWVADESLWEKAKKAVEKTYGTVKGKYAVVVHVYQKMGGKTK